MNPHQGLETEGMIDDQVKGVTERLVWLSGGTIIKAKQSVCGGGLGINKECREMEMRATGFLKPHFRTDLSRR
jgi:hypothetical protein